MRDCIYVKESLGRNREPIHVYKFRTMELDADRNLEAAISGGFDSLGNPIRDFRVTGVGKFLRKYWVDELPQFINLANGDLKLVGIRPMREIDWKRYPREIMNRALQQRPGLMGVQYAHPSTADFESHLTHLRTYLDQWEEHPARTDRDYLLKIIKNILLGGARSS
jgi:lipopolysaccharide/colanic/teichoic acid biosynthesis glycosyltransferase